MKKLLLSLVLSIVAVSAFAVQQFNVMQAPAVQVARPYQDLLYTQLHKLTTEKEDSKAYLEGGLRYYYGYAKRLDIPFHKDYTAAAKWFYKAGMKDNAIASYYLGRMYINAQGVKQDYKSAIWWLEKARSLGQIQADLELANLYYNLYKTLSPTDSYRRPYLEAVNKYLDELMAKDYAYAYYNKGLVMLETQELTRFNTQEIEQTLLKSLNLFIEVNDKENSYKVLSLISHYKLPIYRVALATAGRAFK